MTGVTKNKIREMAILKSYNFSDCHLLVLSSKYNIKLVIRNILLKSRLVLMDNKTYFLIKYTLLIKHAIQTHKILHFINYNL